LRRNGDHIIGDDLPAKNKENSTNIAEEHFAVSVIGMNYSDHGA